jgi:hypothetical protein
VTKAIAHLVTELYTHFDQLSMQPSIVANIQQRLFREPQADTAQSKSSLCLVPRKRTHSEVLQLKETGKYSIKDICALSKISQSQFYEICKRKKYNHEHPQNPKTPKPQNPKTPKPKTPKESKGKVEQGKIRTPGVA